MQTFRRMSVRQWIKVLGNALDTAYHDPQYLKKLRDQHHSIRSWDIAPGGSVKPTDGNGWRLLK